VIYSLFFTMAAPFDDDGGMEEVEEKNNALAMFLAWQQNGGLARAAAEERAEERAAARAAAVALLRQEAGPAPVVQPNAAELPPSWMPTLLSAISTMQSNAGTGAFRSFHREDTAMMHGAVMAMKSLPAGTGEGVPSRRGERVSCIDVCCSYSQGG
jgi:hypothetical protein